MDGNGVFEMAVAWAFILLRLLVFGALVWYGIYEYRRWSRKGESSGSGQDKTE